eukprot:2114276-Prymnesium_polylepis.1
MPASLATRARAHGPPPASPCSDTSNALTAASSGSPSRSRGAIAPPCHGRSAPANPSISSAAEISLSTGAPPLTETASFVTGVAKTGCAVAANSRYFSFEFAPGPPSPTSTPSQALLTFALSHSSSFSIAAPSPARTLTKALPPALSTTARFPGITAYDPSCSNSSDCRS